jgi:hypothetical protein
MTVQIAFEFFTETYFYFVPLGSPNAQTLDVAVLKTNMLSRTLNPIKRYAGGLVLSRVVLLSL